MARCSTCDGEFPEGTARCPRDGTPLGGLRRRTLPLDAPGRRRDSRDGRVTGAADAADAVATIVTPIPPAATSAAGAPAAAGAGAGAAGAMPGPPGAVSAGTQAPAAAGPAAASQPELPAGTLVGEYVVTGKTGEGGMGVVYAARHPVIGKKAAVKVLATGLSSDPSASARFVQEAQAVNRIGHPNIVDIFAFGRLDDGRQYFVMEYVEGRSLKALLRERRPLAFGEAREILRQVLDALGAAHAQGIVHRDLKPDNVLLIERFGAVRVKLADFGVAKLIDTEGDSRDQTRTGSLIGTPLYMSPEQCQGAQVDARADIYSLGVLMYEMFTGSRPFEGESQVEVMFAHMTQAPPPPRTVADVPEALDRLIMRCLSKNPGDRPADAGELRADLEAALQDAPAERSAEVLRVIAPGVSGSSRVLGESLVPRRRRGVGLGAAVGALLVGAGALAGSLLWRADEPPGKAGAAAPPPAVAASAATPDAGRPRTAAPAPPTLDMLADADGARFLLDGKIVAEGRRATLTGVAPGPHVLRLEAHGRAPHEQTVVLGPGERRRVEVRLDRLEPPERPERTRGRPSVAAVPRRKRAAPSGPAPATATPATATPATAAPAAAAPAARAEPLRRASPRDLDPDTTVDPF